MRTFLILITLNLSSALYAKSHVIFDQDETDGGFCGGVKVSERSYLTAAHCVKSIHPQYSGLVVDKTFTVRSKNVTAKIEIEDVFFPHETLENLRCKENPWYRDCPFVDVAIINVIERNEIEISPLDHQVSPQLDSKIEIHSNYLSLGVVLIHEQSSGDIFESYQTTYLFNDDQGSLEEGDSGSPIFIDGNLVGLVSFMNSRYLGGFTSIMDPSILKFIQNHIK